ncbi:MAG: carboxymuconolactone decarboxylase family protein, partial [Chitinophagaceae bacterium]
KGSDPELMNILQEFIFGDVFHTGVLPDKKRELITIVTLVTQQTLPQLKAHTKAALNIGVTPIEIREAVYQCAPYLGYPKTLNALNTINEVFEEKGIPLPLENQATVTEENRFEKGKAIQDSLYGHEIKEMMKELPGDFKVFVPQFLTEANFGDFYTRGGLDIKTRELLMYCVLATLGAEFQLNAHVKGSIRAGNTKEELIAAMVQCIGYIGFPKAINAINIIIIL